MSAIASVLDGVRSRLGGNCVSDGILILEFGVGDFIFVFVRADDKDDMARADSVKFRSVFTQVEDLHRLGMNDHSLAYPRSLEVSVFL